MTVLADHVLEATNCLITSRLEYPIGTLIPGADITAITVSLFDRVTGIVINGRRDQDVKNVNGGQLNVGTSVLTLELGPADNVIQNDDDPGEEHVILFHVAWTTAGIPRAGFFSPLILTVDRAPAPAPP